MNSTTEAKCTAGEWHLWPNRLATLNGYSVEIIGSENSSVAAILTDPNSPAYQADIDAIRQAPELLRQRNALREALEGIYPLVPIEISNNEPRLIAARKALAMAQEGGK